MIGVGDAPSWYFASMSSGFRSLGTDDIRANGTCFDDVLRVADKVHVKDTIVMQLFNNFFGCNANSRHE